MNDQTTPNVTRADIESSISSEHYFTASDGIAGVCYRQIKALHSPHELALLTFCVLVTCNGHTVTGESYCKNPAEFNTVTGQELARKDAINKLWPMAVYAARSKLAES